MRTRGSDKDGAVRGAGRAMLGCARRQCRRLLSSARGESEGVGGGRAALDELRRRSKKATSRLARHELWQTRACSAREQCCGLLCWEEAEVPSVRTRLSSRSPLSRSRTAAPQLAVSWKVPRRMRTRYCYTLALGRWSYRRPLGTHRPARTPTSRNLRMTRDDGGRRVRADEYDAPGVDGSSGAVRSVRVWWRRTDNEAIWTSE